MSIAEGRQRLTCGEKPLARIGGSCFVEERRQSHATVPVEPFPAQAALLNLIAFVSKRFLVKDDVEEAGGQRIDVIGWGGWPPIMIRGRTIKDRARHVK